MEHPPGANSERSRWRRAEEKGIFLSAVAPCYNEATGLSEFVRRLSAACGQFGRPYEIILVNDGSTDASWAEICRLSDSYREVVGLDLARNFGHQLALTAGLSVARGERIFILDADLQDPPELLREMMKELDEGAEVAFGQRLSRAGETQFKELSAKTFYRLLAFLTDHPIPVDTGDFRLMTRRVLDSFLDMPERHRFVRGMIAWIGFRQVGVPYHRDARFAGETKYPLKKMVAFALDALTGFSTKPLRIGFYIGLSAVVAAGLLSAYALWSWISADAVPGWTSLMILILLFGGAQMFCLAIMGEYVGRIYIEAKGRPLFIIRSIYNSHLAKANTRGPQSSNFEFVSIDLPGGDPSHFRCG